MPIPRWMVEGTSRSVDWEAELYSSIIRKMDSLGLSTDGKYFLTKMEFVNIAWDRLGFDVEHACLVFDDWLERGKLVRVPHSDVYELVLKE